MPAATSMWWAPQRLNATISRANVASFKVAHVDALARRHNTSMSDVRLAVPSDTMAILIPKGLQATFEKGRTGGYEINAGGDIGVRRSYSKTKGATFRVRGKSTGSASPFLGFNSNGPGTGGTGVRYGPVRGGPMRPYPAMGPAGWTWAMGGYTSTARKFMLAAGFGGR